MRFKYMKIFEMKTDVLLKQELPTRLREYGYQDLVIGDTYLYAPGTLPVCLVAHVDVVHHRDVPYIIYDRKKAVLWSPDGLGADDRAGVSAIMQILDDGFRPHVIFLDGEERGLIGASAAAKAIPAPADLRFMAEMDRKGVKDAVYYDLDNKKFEKYVERFGFKTDSGSCSDISKLAPAWGVAAVNLSIGYFDAHQKTEHLYLNVWESTILKVEQMLMNIPHKMYHYYPKFKTTTTYNNWGTKWDNDYGGYNYYRGPVNVNDKKEETPKTNVVQGNFGKVNDFRKEDGTFDWEKWDAANPTLGTRGGVKNPIVPVGNLNAVDSAILRKAMHDAEQEELITVNPHDPYALQQLALDQGLIDEILEQEKLSEGEQIKVSGRSKAESVNIYEENQKIFEEILSIAKVEDMEEIDEEAGLFDMPCSISAEDLSFEYGGTVEGWRKWLERQSTSIQGATEDTINILINKLVNDDANWIIENIIQPSICV